METKRAQVIMLPTKEKSHIGLYTDIRGKLDIYYKNALTPQIKTFFPQHLYITTDDEIKEGDWVYWNDPEELTSDINQVHSIKGDIVLLSHPKHSETECFINECNKIIVTTDKSLRVPYNNGDMNDLIILPQPSQAFIEKYCKEGGIDEVLVEYEWEEGDKFELDNLDTARFINDTELENCSGTIFNKSELSKADLKYVAFDKDAHAKLKLKVDEHNTITIHPIKNSWSREEVESLLFKYAEDEHAWFSTKGEADQFNNWIKENL